MSLLGHPIVDQREHVETDLKPTLRPVFTRQESVNILSYYQSPLADQGISYAQQQQHQPSDAPAQRPPLRQRTLSGGSSSSSNYSAASDTEARSASSPASSRPRSSIPSDGGSDRRRVAIVELDQPQDHRKTRSSESGADDVVAESPGLRSRRGFRNDPHGLALVAPPDASPRAYSMQAPPSSAPSASGSNLRPSSLPASRVPSGLIPKLNGNGNGNSEQRRKSKQQRSACIMFRTAC